MLPMEDKNNQFWSKICNLGFLIKKLKNAMLHVLHMHIDDTPYKNYPIH